MPASRSRAARRLPDQAQAGEGALIEPAPRQEDRGGDGDQGNNCIEQEQGRKELIQAEDSLQGRQEDGYGEI